MPKILETLRHALHIDRTEEAALSLLLKYVQGAHYPTFPQAQEIAEDSPIAQILNGFLSRAGRPTFIGGSMLVTVASERGFFDGFLLRPAKISGNLVLIQLNTNGDNTPKPEISKITVTSVGTPMGVFDSKQLPVPDVQKILLKSVAEIVFAQTWR